MFKNAPVKALIDIQNTIGEAQDLLLTLEHIISTPQIPPQEVVMVQTKRAASRLSGAITRSTFSSEKLFLKNSAYSIDYMAV